MYRTTCLCMDLGEIRPKGVPATLTGWSRSGLRLVTGPGQAAAQGGPATRQQAAVLSQLLVAVSPVVFPHVHHRGGLLIVAGRGRVVGCPRGWRTGVSCRGRTVPSPRIGRGRIGHLLVTHLSVGYRNR